MFTFYGESIIPKHFLVQFELDVKKKQALLVSGRNSNQGPPEGHTENMVGAK
jgi:hypothetical protein